MECGLLGLIGIMEIDVTFVVVRKKLFKAKILIRDAVEYSWMFEETVVHSDVRSMEVFEDALGTVWVSGDTVCVKGTLSAVKEVGPSWESSHWVSSEDGNLSPVIASKAVCVSGARSYV